MPGCRSSRNLDIHHIVPRYRGGTNALWNLILLCSGHHAALHAGLLTITGRAPHDIQVAWLYKPLPLNLDASARRRFITRQVAELFNGPLPDDWVPPGTDDLDPSDRDYDPVWHDPAFVRRPTAGRNVNVPAGTSPVTLLEPDEDPDAQVVAPADRALRRR